MQKKVENKKEADVVTKVKTAIKKAAPKAVETVSYGIPTFDLNGKHLVHIAAYEKHLGFYPTPSAIVAFKKELAPYKTSKGAVQFPLNQPMPLALITRMVRFRIKEVTAQTMPLSSRVRATSKTPRAK